MSHKEAIEVMPVLGQTAIPTIRSGARMRGGRSKEPPLVARVGRGGITKERRCPGLGQKDQPPAPASGLNDDAGQAQAAADSIMFNSDFLSFLLDRPAREPSAAHARNTMGLRCLLAIVSAQCMIWNC
jgi:hypothetical protein